MAVGEDELIKISYEDFFEIYGDGAIPIFGKHQSALISFEQLYRCMKVRLVKEITDEYLEALDSLDRPVIKIWKKKK